MLELKLWTKAGQDAAIGACLAISRSANPRSLLQGELRVLASPFFGGNATFNATDGTSETFRVNDTRGNLGSFTTSGGIDVPFQVVLV